MGLWRGTERRLLILILKACLPDVSRFCGTTQAGDGRTALVNVKSSCPAWKKHSTNHPLQRYHRVMFIVTCTIYRLPYLLGGNVREINLHHLVAFDQIVVSHRPKLHKNNLPHRSASGLVCP